MKKKLKASYSITAGIISVVLFMATLTGCSNNGIQVAGGSTPTSTEGTTPTVKATASPTTTATPTNSTTPTNGATTTPTKAPTKVTTKAPTKAPTKATTKAPTKAPTKKPTSTPAPTIKASDKGTSAVVSNSSAPVSNNITPVASGKEVYSNDKASIDASNKSKGYIMVKHAKCESRIKLRITVPGGTVYTYNLNSTGKYETFPLSGGNGSYTVKVYRNVSGTKYTTDFSQTISVKLNDQFAPFLHSNQYVNYSSSSKAVAVAKQVTSGSSSTLAKVQKVYTYVATNIKYDYDKASSVKSGYLPNLDTVLSTRKGICFDYAALMTAMLRSQNIPTKLVVGYANSAYHAWISVYVSGTGWVDGVIYFNGKNWEIMDPTFASTQGSEAIKSTKYSAKYLY